MKPNVEKEIRKIIGNHLREIGVQMNVVGYRYLKEAIYLVVEEPSRAKGRTTELYEIIAIKYGISNSKVCHGITRIINNIIGRGNWEAIEKYFKKTNPKTGKPTNKQFIITVANKVLDDLKKCNFD